MGRFKMKVQNFTCKEDVYINVNWPFLAVVPLRHLRTRPDEKG